MKTISSLFAIGALALYSTAQADPNTQVLQTTTEHQMHGSETASMEATHEAESHARADHDGAAGQVHHHKKEKKHPHRHAKHHEKKKHHKKKHAHEHEQTHEHTHEAHEGMEHHAEHAGE